VLLLTVAVVFPLARQVIRMALGRIALGMRSSAEQPLRVVGVAWRVAALSTLVAVTVALAAILGPIRSQRLDSGPNPAHAKARESILRLCGLFVLLGVLAGMRPAAPASRSPARFSSRAPLVVAAAGVGLVAG
jgi:hypothetical protein